MGRNFLAVVAVVLLIGLGIGIFVTARLDIPKPTPWWFGKKTVVRAEVWEPGKDMATFAMTIPKETLDALYVFGMKSKIDMDGHTIALNRVWKDLQRLPRGEKLRFEESGATLSMWIEERGANETAAASDSATQR